MSATSYLNRLANQAIIRDLEKETIDRSIGVLRHKLRRYFQRDLTEQFPFGSYARGTILPRCMDPGSDIDVMVVFADDRYRPQTYLDRLRRFVEASYTRSEIAQSHPTIVLELNHIRFELVPAVRGWGGYQIPAPASDYLDWIETNPNGFNAELTAANRRHRSQIKRLVRVAKYWNVRAGKPFASYDLERRMVALPLLAWAWAGAQPFSRYFYDCIDGLFATPFGATWKREVLDRAKRAVRTARVREQAGDVDGAEAVIQQLLPWPLPERGRSLRMALGSQQKGSRCNERG